MLIDSHCHIHDADTYDFALSRAQISHKTLGEHPEIPHKKSDFTPEKLIERAHMAGIQKMICIGTSHKDSLAARDFATAHSGDGVFWSYGIHPDEADDGANDCSSSELLACSRQSLRGSLRKARSTKVARCSSDEPQPSTLVAIGEVGLDYHGKSIAENGADYREKQIELFEQMLQLAEDNNLPLIFHVREAYDDFFAVLDNFPEVRGVVHSFSDTAENLAKSLDRGFYIGVNGMATFSDTIPLPPLERMLLETDAPFLTPVPFRGRINEPAYIKEICAFISKVKGESEKKVAQITSNNAEQIFNI